MPIDGELRPGFDYMIGMPDGTFVPITEIGEIGEVGEPEEFAQELEKEIIRQIPELSGMIEIESPHGNHYQKMMREISASMIYALAQSFGRNFFEEDETPLVTENAILRAIGPVIDHDLIIGIAAIAARKQENRRMRRLRGIFFSGGRKKTRSKAATCYLKEVSKLIERKRI